MFSCCHCNCANYISGITLANANVVIESLDFEQPICKENITLNISVTIQLEGTSVNRQNDLLYLKSSNDFLGQSVGSYYDLESDFIVKLTQQDDSSGQFFISLKATLKKGVYKILYLRGRSKVEDISPGTLIGGRWDNLGASDSFKLELVNGENEISVCSPSCKKVKSRLASSQNSQNMSLLQLSKGMKEINNFMNNSQSSNEPNADSKEQTKRLDQNQSKDLMLSFHTIQDQSEQLEKENCEESINKSIHSSKYKKMVRKF